MVSWHFGTPTACARYRRFIANRYMGVADSAHSNPSCFPSCHTDDPLALGLAWPNLCMATRKHPPDQQPLSSQLDSL
jgi:hypothetical protein